MPPSRIIRTATKLFEHLARKREPAQLLEVLRARRLVDRHRAALVGSRRDDLLRFLDVAGQRPLGLGAVPRAVLELARAVRDLREPHHRSLLERAVAPLAGIRI